MRSVATFSFIAFLIASTLAKAASFGLIDVPDIAFRSQNVELGLRIKEKTTKNFSVASVTSTASVSAQKTTTARLQSDKRTLLDEVSSSMNAGVGIDSAADKVFSVKIGGQLNTLNKDSHELTWSDVRTYDDSLAYTKSVTGTEERTQSSSIETEADSGYIHTGFTITNNWKRPVVLSHIRATIVLADPSDSDQFDAVASTTIKEGLNTYPWQAATIETPERRPTDLEVTLAPGQPLDQVLNFEKINTNQLLAWITLDKRPQLRVTYDLRLEAKESPLYSLSSNVASALSEGVHLIVVGPNPSAQQFFVRSEQSDRRASAIDALRAAGYQVEVNESADHKKYISRINFWKADCDPSDLSNVQRALQAPSESAWVVSAEGGFAGRVDEPAPPGTRFLVAFVSRRDRLRSMAKSNRLEGLSLPFPEESTKLVLADISHREWPAVDPSNDRFVSAIPVGFVRAGDVVSLWVRGWRTCFMQAYLAAAPDPSFTLPNVPAGWFDATFVQWANAVYGQADCSTWASMSVEEISGDHGLSVDFGGGPIKLRDVLPRGKQWREVYPDGTVRLRFVVSDKMLTKGPTILNLVMNPPAANTLNVGRSVAYNPSVPQPPVPCRFPNLCDAPGAAGYWMNKDPVKSQAVPEKMTFAIDAETLSEPTGKPSERVIHSLSDDEAEALAAAKGFWKAIAEKRSDDIWSAVVSPRKTAMNKEEWLRQLFDLRDKLGPELHREILGIHLINYSSAHDNLPAGAYVSVGARTEFKNHPERQWYVTERLLLRRESNNAWGIVNFP